MGRPVKNDRRQIVNAILYVTTTGCQWRALPARYPNWNTVHHYRLAWARDGTLERLAERLAVPVEAADDARRRAQLPPSTSDSVPGDHERARMSRPARTPVAGSAASPWADAARAGAGADALGRDRDPGA
jgi:transposase